MDENDLRNLLDTDTDDAFTNGRTSKSKNRLWFYLEWIPLSLLSLGILLHYLDNDYWTYPLVGGGISSTIIFLLFSTRLLQPNKSSHLEKSLSIISGILVATSMATLIAKQMNWGATQLHIAWSLYALLAWLGVVAFSFLLHIRQTESSPFYRTLLARLFILLILIYSLSI